MPSRDIDTLIADNQHHPNVAWRRVPEKGWGVFARRPLSRDAIVEWGPMSRFPATDLKTDEHRDCEVLHHVFAWSESGRDKALLWGFLAPDQLTTPNITIDDGPVPGTAAAVALRDIDEGEELCFDYGYTWFDVR